MAYLVCKKFKSIIRKIIKFNKVNLLNMYILIVYLLSGLISNNKYMLMHSVKSQSIETIVPQVRTWCKNRDWGELMDCYCSNDIHCTNTGSGSLDITFYSARILRVVCQKETSFNINFLLKTRFQSILLQSEYLEAKHCKDFIHEGYMVPQIIINMKKRNKLTLVYNKDLITESTQNLYIAPNLLHLQLIVKSSADIVTVPTDLFYTHYKLKTLTFSVQSLTNKYVMLQNLTQTYFRNLKALRQLDLAGNNMKILDANLFATLAKLNYLNLSRNEIQELSRNLFANQSQLIILDLSNNLLTYLTPDLFTKTPLIWQLKLNGNRLHDTINLSENLKPLHYLHCLDLSKNKLQTIWGTAIYANTSARLLTNFNVNMGSTLEQALNYISKLQPEMYAGIKHNSTVINLSHNLLPEFNMDWHLEAGLTCPFQINLEHNIIQNIYALSNFRITTDDCEREIKMTGNPVECDCTLAWIYNDNYRSFFSDLQCNQTSTKLVKDIAQARRVDMCTWQPILCSRNCDCYIQSKLLLINCSGAQLDFIEQLPRPEQVTLTSSVLDISSNQFTVLPLNTTFGYANVSQLYVSYNKITNISLSQLSTNLTVLDLRNNRLKSLSAEFLCAFLNDSSKLQILYLSENRWFCDCAAQHLIYSIREHRKRIPDVEQLYCDNLQNVTLLTANVGELCQSADKVERYQYVNTTVISAALVIIILLLNIALYYKYKLEVKVWLYSHNILSCCINERELDKNKIFDAFISYAHQDADFVNHILLPQLEHCEPQFRICTHERNWLAGAYIPEQIIESVEQSRRTIIVLSQHFIESDWARMEFRTAHQSSLNEGRTRIIIIKYSELTNTELLDREFKAYLDMNTYLDWKDARFWEKLRYAMPHQMSRERSADMLEVNGRMYVMGQVEMNRLRGGGA